MIRAFACRFCAHAVHSHSPILGCPYCNCAANRVEASREVHPAVEFAIPRAQTWAGYYPLYENMDPGACHYHSDERGYCVREADHPGTHSFRRTPRTLERKGADMPEKNTYRDLAEVDAEIDRRKRELAALEEEREQLKSLPAEPPVDSVIRFTIQYDSGGTVYRYIAYRFDQSRDGWTMSGNRYTWGELLAYMGRDVYVRSGKRGPEFYVYGTRDGRWVR